MKAITGVLLACVALAGCERQGLGAPAGPGASGADWPSPSLPFVEGNARVWSGVLPCRDCEGVDTRLVLQLKDRKRSYLVTETYLGGEGPNRFTHAGRWLESTRLVAGERRTTYTLDPGQAAQTFALQPDGSLELLDADGSPQAQPIAYRLHRL